LEDVDLIRYVAEVSVLDAFIDACLWKTDVIEKAGVDA